MQFFALVSCSRELDLFFVNDFSYKCAYYWIALSVRFFRTCPRVNSIVFLTLDPRFESTVLCSKVAGFVSAS